MDFFKLFLDENCRGGPGSKDFIIGKKYLQDEERGSVQKGIAQI
jgi:hypothetical protein